ncbi:hypothetical protein [Paenibacillus dendritiformis]|uniref:hypothetical protein n=1 Tax=Paenibacillus dendritiformis TaxID=130049 RepID=UPI00387E1584
MSDLRIFGFMNKRGELKTITLSNEDIKRGELRAHIAFMMEEGFTIIGEEVKNNLNNKI